MDKNKPLVSIVIPIYDMPNGAFFLWRAINSIVTQSYQNYELIITKDGKMAENTNSGIKKAKGDLIKILFMDDYFSSEYALDDIVMHFTGEWMISGCDTNPHPYWTDDIETGNNHLGSPSCLTFRNHFEDNLLFDENLSWLLDCDLYKRLYNKYGEPQILDTKNINIGIHEGQATNLLSDDYKLSEHRYMLNKYDTSS